MPLYTYYCPACDKDSEQIIAIKDRDSQRCQCGYQLVRAIDRPGLVWAPTTGKGMR